MFAKFENLHPNNTSAFIDGILCGIVLTCMVTDLVKTYRAGTKRRKLAEQSIKEAWATAQK